MYDLVSSDNSIDIYRKKTDGTRFFVATFDISDNYSEDRSVRSENQYYDYMEMAKNNKKHIFQVLGKFTDSRDNPGLILEYIHLNLEMLILR